MQPVRRWYADQPVWVVLDRDSPHPCKSRQTRRQMRQLKLHWITLPTGSPDDNPVETLFSDIQLMILDTSNDPDIRTTQRRISNYLRRCNRRRQRTVCVPYLPDSSKHS
jgi:transposase